MANGIRAFSNPKYDYYELTEDLAGLVPKGTIFVHDTDDSVRGSVAQGCLVSCWTPDGNCYKGERTSLAGGSVVFHAEFRNTPMFKKVAPLDQAKLKEIYSTIDSVKQQISDLENVIGKFVGRSES